MTEALHAEDEPLHLRQLAQDTLKDMRVFWKAGGYTEEDLHKTIRSHLCKAAALAFREARLLCSAGQTDTLTERMRYYDSTLQDSEGFGEAADAQ